MIEISVDTSRVVKLLDGAVESLDELNEKVTTEFVTWQRTDMRRTYPNVDRLSEDTVETKIWPRSRLTKQNLSRRHRQRATGIHKGVVVHSRGGTPAPILRPTLFDKLCQRMRGILAGLIPWQ